MADDKNLAGARETRPRSLGFRIREHRGIEGVKETSARPRMGPVDVVGAVAAMAGGKELHGAAGRALEAVKHGIKGMGRKRGARGFSQREKRSRRRLGDGGPRGGADGCGFRGSSECERERGRQQGERRGVRHPFVEAGRGEDAPMTRDVGTERRLQACG